MPDGSGLSSSALAVAWLTGGHRVEIDRAQDTMDFALWARAAVAWLQVVAPRTVPRAAPDPDGVAFHLRLFATDAKYWSRLCVLFDRRGLSDRGSAG